MDSNKVTPEIALTSNGDGTFTLAIGHKTVNNITLDEALAIISGKELEDGQNLL